MAPRTCSASKPRDDKPETPRKRRRVDDPENVDAPFARPRLGPTKRAAERAHRESKKKGKATSKRMKDEGKLAVFMGLPLDIFLEVTSFLTPADILQLSRVSNDFRELFNPHTARRFWVDARRNVPGLPECPIDLNDAQYASLLFENHCQACGSTPRANNTDYVLRHRTCQTCYEELTKAGDRIVMNLGCKEPDPIIFRLVPPSCLRYIPDLNTDYEFGGYNRYNVRELISVIEQYSRLEINKEKQQEFVKERQKLAKMMMETGRAMLKWQNNQKKQKQEEDQVKCELNVQEAKERLLELGWTQKDLNDTKNRIKDCIYQSRELTPLPWKQSLPLLQEAMMTSRRKCRLEELEKLWRPVLQKVVPTSEWIFILDDFEEVKDIPCVRTLLERDKANIELTSQALEDIFPAVLQETRAYQDAARRIFLRAILESEEYILPLLKGRKTMARLLDKQISPGDLRLFYAHHLFYCGVDGCNERDVMTLAMFYDHLRSTHDKLDPKKWVVGLVESDTIQDVVKEILKVMGLPEDVRVEVVERFDQKLQCGCNEQTRFGFASLVQHFYDCEPSKSHLPSKVAVLVSVQY